MTNISNDMIITNSSLSQVSKELINKRSYKDGTITKVGDDLSIIGDTASGFSETSYFIQNDINFHDPIKNAKITFSGKYSPAEDVSCAWALSGGAGIPNLTLTFTKDMVTVYLGSMVLLRINNLAITFEETTSALVTFTNYYEDGIEVQDCTLFLILNNKRTFTTTRRVSDKISFNNYHSLILGNSPSAERPWQGNINLPDFALYENDSVIYTPSARNTFTFTKVLIGDGTYPLTDSSISILNHVYECSIKEISRTENNILLTSTIPANAYLNIAELALYYVDDTGTHIFSKINNLNVKKGRDLSYNLVLHVKLDINVVNTLAVPEIIIKKEQYSNFSDFTTIKQIYSYIVTNIERLIRLNAFGIGRYENSSIAMTKSSGVGFNKPQMCCRKEDSLRLLKDNYFATCNYLKLKNKFTPYTVTTFNPSNLQQVGTVVLNETTGICSAFSDSDYIKSSYFALSTPNNWTLTTKFRTGSVGTNQCIFCFGGDYMNQPLQLNVKNGSLHLVVSEVDKIIVKDDNNTLYTYMREGKRVVGNITYYNWSTNSTNANSTIYTTTYRNLTSSTTLYNVNLESISGWSITEIPYTVSRDESITALTSDTDYLVQIKFLNGLYTISYSKSNGATQEKLFSFTSNINTPENSYFGVQYNSDTTTSNHFLGFIDLYDTGLITENYAYSFINTFNYTTELLDYFHIPDYNYHYFQINNLGYNETSYLEEYNGTFKGTIDQINFNDIDGFTFCTKVFLSNTEDKVLLAKGNIEEDEYYFVLEEKDKSILFTLYLSSATIVLKKDFSSLDNLQDYIDSPILITITCSNNQYSPTYRMYKDSELVDEYVLPNYATGNPYNTYLMNHEALNESEYLEEHIVHDIICFKGELLPEEVSYVNNILNINF